ncbi:MAG: hypothetical protein WB611_10615 [Stellaceae bacterium]
MVLQLLHLQDDHKYVLRKADSHITVFIYKSRFIFSGNATDLMDWEKSRTDLAAYRCCHQIQQCGKIIARGGARLFAIHLTEPVKQNIAPFML